MRAAAGFVSLYTVPRKACAVFMRHAIAFVAVCELIVVAIARCEVREADAPVGPQALIHFVADAEYEINAFANVADAPSRR